MTGTVTCRFTNMAQQEKTNLEVFDDFVKDYKSGKMSALVGAGFSMNVSKTYQSWNGLLWDVYKVVYEDEISGYRIQVEDSLMKNAQKQLKEGEVLTEEKLKNIKANVDKQVDDYIYSRIKKENLLLLVSKYIEKVGYREAIDSYIENRTPYAIKGADGKYYLRYFKKQSKTEIVEENMFSAHRSLLRCREFLNIYTTNYDNLLEFAAEHLIKNCIFNPSPISNAESLSDSINKRSIIKIHGSLRTPEDKDFVFDSDHNIRYIIAQEDYTSYIEKHEAFSYLMRIAMLSGTFCLIGFSGSDPNYRNWVNWMKDIICKNPDTGNKVYLIDVDAKKDEKNADMLDSEELFNDNHRVKVIHLYEKEILENIMGIDWKKKVEKDKLIIPERREMLTALFDYLSRTSSANILESESNSNNPNIQYALGVLYYQGENSDIDKAIEHFEKAKNLGSKEAISKLAECYFYNRGKEDYFDKTIELCNKEGVEFNTKLLFGIALSYWSGEGVPVDKSEAVKWFTKAAEQGDADAQYILGICYDNGDGVTEDNSEAVKWYTKAAEQGHAGAQCTLGICYENGYGVSEDKAEAVKWYTKAAEQGLAMAQNQLAWLLHTSGKDQEALPWIEKALEQEPNNAMFIDTLAEVYQGLGRLPEALEQFEKCLAIFKEEGNEKFVKETEEKIRKLKELMG